MLMDIIPLDATLVKGSHGRYPDSPADGPLLMTKNTGALKTAHLEAAQVYDVLLSHLRT